MLLLIFVIIGLALGVLLDLILPAISFFSTGLGWSPIGAAFSGEGWNRAINYVTQGTNWDRWLCVAVLGVSILLWLISFVILLYRGKPGRAFLSIIGVAIHAVVVYIYMAWPNPEVFVLWQRILLYVSFILFPLSQLWNLVSGKE